ncbi:hypothetical protein Asp14428_20380 [Actinoplanes sp. NBRC 14428]|nr:hypothetical protein Asp14428_20380 [Actinoplanes sp. NBRC 14428]
MAVAAAIFALPCTGSRRPSLAARAAAASRCFWVTRFLRFGSGLGACRSAPATAAAAATVRSPATAAF